MIRHGNIFPKVYDMDNLRLAHKNARKDKLFYKEVKMVDSCPDIYLYYIHLILKRKTYKVSEYTLSTINDKGKERELAKLPYYPDRIIQWALMLQLEPIFMETFCDFTCASIKYRGIAHAQKLLRSYLKDVEGTRYCLKMDLRKFYPSIDHEILKSLLRKKIKDPDVLWILDMIVDSSPCEKGVPIGSYLSQYFANYYIAYFDHWLKEEKGAKYVVRYMDDIVILHGSKDFLHRLRRDIAEYLDENLKLSIKDNWQVFPVDIRGIDFIGYRQFHDYSLLRKSTCNRMKTKLKRIKQKADGRKQLNYSEWCCVNSYNGWLMHCDAHRLTTKYVTPIKPALDKYYNEVIKK